ncbi:MAG: PH domain-containing protein [Nitrososphaerota archaeon]|nr:PH domain-containing protein [Candidatus Calditenuaceae archaeon]MDW8073489.1 PH domain-containing protein [Nitrososphaerota archaeon]
MVETFKPSKKMVSLYFIYLGLTILPIVVMGAVATYVVYVEVRAMEAVLVVSLIFFGSAAAIAAFTVYWVPRYYESIVYELSDDEVVVRRGVWWKMKHVVPYSRVMSIDVVQGPISRRLGIATVDVHTAGYTGAAGGSAGPGTRRAEAAIIHVSSPEEIKDKILSRVRPRPLFGQPGFAVRDEVLDELRRIRDVLESVSDRLSSGGK